MIKRTLSAAIIAILTTVSLCADSLWNERYSKDSLYSDVKARKPGDIITIIISEKTDIKNKENTELKKNSSTAASVSKFEFRDRIAPESTTNPFPDFAWSGKRNFKGEANYDHKADFTTTMTAVVKDVLPNGNMIVEGSREITVQGETKNISISGVVNPNNISASNTISSEYIAEARIIYEGEGDFTDTNSQGFLGRLISKIWPF